MDTQVFWVLIVIQGGLYDDIKIYEDRDEALAALVQRMLKAGYKDPNIYPEIIRSGWFYDSGCIMGNCDSNDMFQIGIVERSVIKAKDND